MSLNEALTLERVHDRTNLRAGLDGLRSRLDNSGAMAALDSFSQQAVGILTSGRFAAAMDLSREDPRVLRRRVGFVAQAPEMLPGMAKPAPHVRLT